MSIARRGFIATVFGALVSPWLPKKKAVSYQDQIRAALAKVPHVNYPSAPNDVIFIDKTLYAMWKTNNFPFIINPQESCHESLAGFSRHPLDPESGPSPVRPSA